MELIGVDIVRGHVVGCHLRL